MGMRVHDSMHVRMHACHSIRLLRSFSTILTRCFCFELVPVAEKYDVDPARIYAMGIGNGGFMALRCARALAFAKRIFIL
eukprot:758401-Pyramimonas_sp.AAC.2